MREVHDVRQVLTRQTAEQGLVIATTLGEYSVLKQDMEGGGEPGSGASGSSLVS
jgi:hypothetical protein